MIPKRGFPDMVGDWEGTAIYVEAGGAAASRRRLRVACRIDGEVMSIVNTFTDEAGVVTVANVRGEFDSAGRLHINSERTEGVAWESDGNIVAEWRAKAD